MALEEPAEQQKSAYVVAEVRRLGVGQRWERSGGQVISSGVSTFTSRETRATDKRRLKCHPSRHSQNSCVQSNLFDGLLIFILFL